MMISLHTQPLQGDEATATKMPIIRQIKAQSGQCRADYTMVYQVHVQSCLGMLLGANEHMHAPTSTHHVELYLPIKP